MSISLKEELEAAGYNGDHQQFRDAVVDAWFNMYPTWTSEELFKHPREALHLCNVVRHQTGLMYLPDHIILRTLENTRKRGDLPRIAQKVKRVAIKPSKN